MLVGHTITLTKKSVDLRCLTEGRISRFSPWSAQVLFVKCLSAIPSLVRSSWPGSHCYQSFLGEPLCTPYLDPSDIGALRMDGRVVNTEDVSDLIQE
jgi:hypothetical protein